MNLRNQLDSIVKDLSLLGVESVVMLGAILLLIFGLIFRKNAVIKLIYCLTLLLAFFLSITSSETGYFLSKSLFSDANAINFSSLFILVSLAALLFLRKKHALEFYFLLLALLIGASFMIRANSFLLLYLSVELVSYVSYILTSFSFTRGGHEAAIKYLLFGAVSSAIMLIGLGLIYGSTGTFFLSDWSSEMFEPLLPQLGWWLLLFGIFFKASLFPFHIWTPATYQAAPVDAVALFSIIPKLAGLVLISRLLQSTELTYTGWNTQVILVLGIMTILVGTFGALNQSNTRRMLSFGSIAHSGFLLAFLVTPEAKYLSSFWWYAVIYSIMNLGAFFIIDRAESHQIFRNQEYGNLKHEYWLGGIFTIILISLVGLPPLAGFTAKFFLFSSLWEMYQTSGVDSYLWYLLVVIFATVASLFFYLRIPYYLFLADTEKSQTSPSIHLLVSTKITATIFGVLLLLLFFVPKLVVVMQHLFNNVHE